MATVTHRYKTGPWYTAGPTVMSIAGAHKLRDRLLREGYQVRIQYL